MLKNNATGLPKFISFNTRLTTYQSALVYVADTGRPNCLYHNGIQNGALPAFPLVLGTTKSHWGTGQGCMGDDLRHRAQILSDIPVP